MGIEKKLPISWKWAAVEQNRVKFDTLGKYSVYTRYFKQLSI